MTPDLKIKIGRTHFKNPVMVASGTFGYAEEFADLLDLKKLGAIVSKTITVKPRQGNIPPRTCETPAGLINSIGLENPGIDGFIENKLPVLKKFGPPIIVSIASEGDPGEFVILAKRLDKLSAVTALEINISCPNVKDAGKNLKTKLISQDPKATYAVVKAVRRVTGKTLITKLSPNVTDIVEIAQAAQDAGSDALALINTVQGMAIDIKTRQPKIAMVVGGLSGPAIRPIALRMVWEVYRKVGIPIIGMGGIADTESALEFFIAGASAISVGTQNFIDPGVSVKIVSGISKYLQKNKINSLKKLVGTLECKI
ncbi:MAG: dihydroorotate dehydrogenase [Candidatus Omnitrophica bacterium]|nr:dihydroorotate dehydrogenase [Candidatus Omnitrophota bacterium]